MRRVVFITGNQDKVAYMNSILGIQLDHRKLPLVEIQSANPRLVAEQKAREAYGILGEPVLVEDSYLSFNALNGLPGPFVKFFYESTGGLEMMCRMLDGFNDRSAYTGAVYCYFDGKELHAFDGRLDGSISRTARGKDGYGWDMIFEPAGYGGRTTAELSPKDSREPHNAIDGFQSLRQFLLSDDK